MANKSGPLKGVRIVELTGIGPAPYAAMVMADLGADVIRIDRPGGYPALDPKLDFSAMEAASIFYRSRPLVRVDLKSKAGQQLMLDLVGRADAVIEGYRPGTMERLGLGPETCLKVNPALSYVRVTGWGQEGALSKMAGHDLNYIGLSGALSLFARNGTAPVGVPPLIGDMAGGALFAVIGLLAAVLNARQTGKGQVVDANIVDGSANLYTLMSALIAMGQHDIPAGDNVLDGGRYYYRTYTCQDGRAIAVGAIEPAFRKVLLDKLDLLGDPVFTGTSVESNKDCTQRLAALFATKPAEHWVDLFDGSDGCVTPVLTPAEAAAAPANVERDVFVEVDGITQAAPVPRFSETPGHISHSAREAAQTNPGILTNWGISETHIEKLVENGVLQASTDIRNERH